MAKAVNMHGSYYYLGISLWFVVVTICLPSIAQQAQTSAHSYQAIELNNPEMDFQRDHVLSYNTKGHPKAKGLDITLQYPLSWQASDGKRPNVVQSFKSDPAQGIAMFLLMVKDLPLPEGYIISDDELSEFFTEAELKTMIPADAAFISAKPVILDNHKAGVVNFTPIGQRIDTRITMRVQMYVTIVKNKMVFLQFTVSKQQGHTSGIEEQFRRFEPLFRLITNSFIINNQYTESDYRPDITLKPWRDIVKSEEFLGLSEPERIAVRDRYFEHVSKSLPAEDIEPARQYFAERSASDVKPDNVVSDEGAGISFSPAQNMILSFIITWVIGLTPPLLVRYLFWRKPFKKWPALIISGVFCVGNLMLFIGVLGSQNKTHFVLFLVAWVGYKILRSGRRIPKTNSVL